MPWIDTHCHLDAADFDADCDVVRQNAKTLGVEKCVIPAVMASHFDEVRLLAHRHADAYALGIHPLYTPHAKDTDLATLACTPEGLALIDKVDGLSHGELERLVGLPIAA